MNQSILHPGIRRRRRWWLLSILRHTLLSLLLGGGLLTLGGFGVAVSPALQVTATEWLRRILTDRPQAIFKALEAAVAAGNHPEVIRQSHRFLAAVPLPHPADAFGEQYRRALRALFTSAEAVGNQAERLRAGALALQFDANDSILLFDYGRALAAAGQQTKAIAVLEAAFRIRPNSRQLLQALTSLLAPTQPDRALALRQRHLEALALCMVLPTWMSGNIVAYQGNQSKALGLYLSVSRDTAVSDELGFTPAGIYLVPPRLPELELRISDAALIGANGESVPLTPVYQQHFLTLPDGFARITPADGTAFDYPTVISLALPEKLPVRPRLVLRIACRPSPEVGKVMRAFGTWAHPGVQVIQTD